MGNARIKNRTDMGIVQRIIYLFAFPAIFNKSCGFKNRKLVRNSGLAHFKKIAKTAYAHLAFRKGRKNTDPCFIAENFKNLRGFFKNLFRRHVCLCLFNYMGMFGMNFCQRKSSFFNKLEHMNKYSYVL